jgi:hypothetical protein
MRSPQRMMFRAVVCEAVRDLSRVSDSRASTLSWLVSRARLLLPPLNANAPLLPAGPGVDFAGRLGPEGCTGPVGSKPN